MKRMRRGGFHYDFVGRLRTWMTVSGVVLVVSLVSLGVLRLNLGLEFRGGTAIRVEAKKAATVEQMRDAMEQLKINEPLVQQEGPKGFLVQTEHLGTELQQAAVAQVAKVAGVEAAQVSVTDVGPKWGRQITAKALRALVIFLLIVAIYIWLRFEWKMAGAAMVALFHDLFVTAGIYSLSRFVVTPATVIAILTILGYSLYDTVIIFDRVKEETSRLSAAGRQTYSDVANLSLNNVLIRSLNTSLVVLLPTGSLLFVGSFLLGAETLRELALALFVGVAIGTYSSIFVATPILAAWKEREERWRKLRLRVQARGGEAPMPRAPERETAAEPEPVATGGPPRPRQTRPPRPPQRRRKKRRR